MNGVTKSANDILAAGQFRPINLRVIAVMVTAPVLAAILLLGITGVPPYHFIGIAAKMLGLSCFISVLIGCGYRLVSNIRSNMNEPIAHTIIWLVAAMLVAGITIPTFGLFKQLILPARDFPWDIQLAALDRFIFMGIDPWRLTHAWFGTFYGTIFFDRIYSIWLFLMFGFPPFIVVSFQNTSMRARLIGCWLMGWLLIGGAAAWGLASAGPSYFEALVEPDKDFAELVVRLASINQEAKAVGWTINALDFQPLLLASYKIGIFAPAGGISAMPSVHVAMAALFAIAGFQKARWIGLLFSAYTFLIWVGSIHLGWHYATDGVVGAMMMYALWWLSQLLVPTRSST